jgi:carboxypeptidase family protein
MGLAVTMRRYKVKAAWLIFGVLLSGVVARAQSQEPPVAASVESGPPCEPALAKSDCGTSAEPQPSGSIRGMVVDQTGAFVVGAHIRLTRENPAYSQEVVSDGDGIFSFANVPPGPFEVSITSAAFATQTLTGTVRSGETCTIPQTTMAIATAVTEVRVVPRRVEIAEDEIRAEEKQRVLGVIPNFYVTYVPNAVPLSSKQKFELAWKTTIDPVSIGITGAIAGVQQAQNEFSGYGQGAQGYAKRFGASYADSVSSTFIGSAILPSIFKQDPRYFYKGTGTRRSRILYALANAVICKGDNGHWQANYSGILGSLAAGGISNLYYPAKNRDGAELTFENTLIGIGATAAANLLQEFVVRKLTPNGSSRGAAKTQSAIGKLSNTLVHNGD